MDWYYAINGKRVGPVSEANFAQLVANGVIADDTLVWRKGMAQWVRWDAVAPTVELPPAERIPTAPGFSRTPEAEAETADEHEADDTWTTDEFWERLQQNQFVTSVGGCMGRAWQAYKSAFWPCFGVSALGFLILMVVGLIPFAALLSAFFVTPQITGGLQWYFVQRMRGESPTVATVFTGFSQHFLPLAGVAFLQMVIGIVPVGLMVGILASMGVLNPDNPPDINGPIALLSLAGIAVIVVLMLFVYLRLMLAYVIVIDLGAGVVAAMKLSWRIVGRKILTIIGLVLMLILLSIVGMLALFIGFLFVLPLNYAIFAQLYEDARNSARGQPPLE